MSEARPKVGSYPFTTLEPSLGVVETGYDSMVVADIPGLSEGAHTGAGLGIAFLRHIERTAVLTHVVDITSEDAQTAIDVVRGEMEAFGHGLIDKPWLLALNKIDLLARPEEAAERVREMRTNGVEVYAVSALSGEGVADLIGGLFEQVRQARSTRSEAEEVVLRPRAAASFSVERQDDVFVVIGERPLQVFQKLGIDTEEARLEAERRLRRMGVTKALDRAGARPGARVRFGDFEVDWPL
jgi:GTP-binding protein